MRELKSAKASKGDVEAAVKELLALKQQFKAETGILPHCWHSSFRSEADTVTTARTQATVQGRNRYFATLMALKLQGFRSEAGISTSVADPG